MSGRQQLRHLNSCVLVLELELELKNNEEFLWTLLGFFVFWKCVEFWLDCSSQKFERVLVPATQLSRIFPLHHRILNKNKKTTFNKLFTPSHVNAFLSVRFQLVKTFPSFIHSFFQLIQKVMFFLFVYFLSDEK